MRSLQFAYTVMKVLEMVTWEKWRFHLVTYGGELVDPSGGKAGRVDDCWTKRERRRMSRKKAKESNGFEWMWVSGNRKHMFERVKIERI